MIIFSTYIYAIYYYCMNSINSVGNNSITYDIILLIPLKFSMRVIIESENMEISLEYLL